MRADAHWLASLLPKRKILVRAALCGATASLPLLVIVTLQRWYVVLPFIAAIGRAIYKSDFGEDVRKQLRWMRRMSERGPIYKLMRFFRRQYVRGKRRHYGDAMDVLPLAPTVVGPSVRTTNAVMLKWLVKPHSEFSLERYELQLRSLAARAAEWQQLAAALEEAKHAAGLLTPDTDYEVRVRAHNSKGRSEWCVARFHSKQQPNGGGGGSGPGYSWAQGGKKGEEVTVHVALPAGTRAKQLSVTVMPTNLSITLQPSAGGDPQLLLAGELFAAVRADDIEWELVEVGGEAGGEAGGPGGGKQLKLLLLKKDLQGPFWACLVRGHPEVETNAMKKEPMSNEQLMAQMQELGMGGSMGGSMDGMDSKDSKYSKESGNGMGSMGSMSGTDGMGGVEGMMDSIGRVLDQV